MHDAASAGIIGFTDDGQPLVTALYSCPLWEEGPQCFSSIRECWYCRYADFRKTNNILLGQSICRCPQNRIVLAPNSKNEQIEVKDPDQKHNRNEATD